MTDWEYENEYRLLQALHAADIINKSSEIFLFKFKPCYIKSIIFGAKMDNISKNKIKKIVNEYENHNIYFQNATLNESGINIVKCSE